jgi:hypothetical protein
MRTKNISRQITWTLCCVALAVATLSTEAAESTVIKFQESNDPSLENASALIGHWRKTTIGYTGNDRSNPFTFYQDQLVFPNISNRRAFWEKIE